MAATAGGGGRARPKKTTARVNVGRRSKPAPAARAHATEKRVNASRERQMRAPKVKSGRVSNDSRSSLLVEQSVRRDRRLGRGIDLTNNPRLRNAIVRKMNGEAWISPPRRKSP